MSSKNIKKNFILFWTFLFLLAAIKSSFAFGPAVVDVTSRSFSVIWTAEPWSKPGILFYETDSLEHCIDAQQLKEKGIAVHIDSNEKAKAAGIMKLTINRLKPDTFYYFTLTIDGQENIFKGQIRTEKNYSEVNSLPYSLTHSKNGFLHRAVLHANGKSPGLGGTSFSRINER